MKCRCGIAAVVVGVLALTFGYLFAQDVQREREVAVTCPVTGGPIDESVSINFEGGTLHFSEPECVAMFEAEPEKFRARARLQFLLTGQAEQIGCPMTGDPIDPTTHIDIGGAKVGFCTHRHSNMAGAADLEGQLALIFVKGWKEGFAMTERHGETPEVVGPEDLEEKGKHHEEEAKEDDAIKEEPAEEKEAEPMKEEMREDFRDEPMKETVREEEERAKERATRAWGPEETEELDYLYPTEPGESEMRRWRHIEELY